MSPRLRKLVGSAAMLAYLFAYIALALAIADRLPDSNLVRLAYYAIVGTVWGLPLYPLFVWMNRAPR